MLTLVSDVQGALTILKAGIREIQITCAVRGPNANEMTAGVVLTKRITLFDAQFVVLSSSDSNYAVEGERPRRTALRRICGPLIVLLGIVMSNSAAIPSRPNRPLVVKCGYEGSFRRVNFPSAQTCRLDSIRQRVSDQVG